MQEKYTKFPKFYILHTAFCFFAPSSTRGLGHHPLKVEAWVQIPLRAPKFPEVMCCGL